MFCFPFVQVEVQNKHTYKVQTPSRKKVIRSLVRRKFTSTATALVQSPRMMGPIVTKLVAKIRKEMKHIGSTDHGSILRDTNEAIKQFHWETVRL